MTATDDPFRARRLALVETLRSQRIADRRVLAALATVPRHLFVPPAQHRYAYENHPLPVADGQTISQPYIVALMSELLAIEGGERVLEIGTGSGYQAAVLAELGALVYSVEVRPELLEIGRRNLETTGYESVQTHLGDGHAGWPELAPFDRIILTAAPSEVPSAVLDQLAVGGRLLAPVGVDRQVLIRIDRSPRGDRRQDVCGVLFVPMVVSAGAR
jgi:protein-L-isoaspartate(D-aspartate) O-methyltransferase